MKLSSKYRNSLTSTVSTYKMSDMEFLKSVVVVVVVVVIIIITIIIIIQTEKLQQIGQI